MKIIDPGTGETLPVNEHGEIALKGTTMMKGYNKTFPETYLDDSGYYRTSDSGYFDEEGYLHWTGRMSQVIRTNNTLVSPVGEYAELTFLTLLSTMIPSSEEGRRGDARDHLLRFPIWDRPSHQCRRCCVIRGSAYS